MPYGIPDEAKRKEPAQGGAPVSPQQYAAEMMDYYAGRPAAGPETVRREWEGYPDPRWRDEMLSAMGVRTPKTGAAATTETFLRDYQGAQDAADRRMSAPPRPNEPLYRQHMGGQPPGFGMAASDPAEVARAIEYERMVGRQEAMMDAVGLEVVSEQPPETGLPGMQVEDKYGRLYWIPDYGPGRGEPIEIMPGVDLMEVQEFAKGPSATDEQQVVQALARRGRGAGG
jgi:hypothetical protein